MKLEQRTAHKRSTSDGTAAGRLWLNRHFRQSPFKVQAVRAAPAKSIRLHAWPTPTTLGGHLAQRLRCSIEDGNGLHPIPTEAQIMGVRCHERSKPLVCNQIKDDGPNRNYGTVARLGHNKSLLEFEGCPNGCAARSTYLIRKKEARSSST